MYVEQQDIALAVRAKQKASGGAADQGKQPTRSRALVSQASLNFMLFEQKQPAVVRGRLAATSWVGNTLSWPAPKRRHETRKRAREQEYHA